MLEQLSNFFSQSEFMPHGHCYLWRPSLVYTHVISDILIGTAYLAISLSLYGLIRKIKLPFSAVVLSFGIFIGACGATHYIEVWNLWFADYWFAGMVKVVTAIASVATGVWLVYLSPQIVAFAEAAKEAAIHREALANTNRELGMRTRELEETNFLLAEQQKALAHSAKMSALGEMAGGIAHEINSPLGIITLHANRLERLQNRGQLSGEIIISEARLISSTAKRIGEIIKGLRAFAREGSEDPFEKVRVEQIFKDATLLCSARIGSHGITLETAVDPINMAIVCRPVQICQVIVNLLSNAFDAVQTAEAKWIKVRAIEAPDHIFISVEDSGHGVSPNVKDKIMQPFFTTKEVGHGTGLGLSISKGIAQAHGGTLTLEDCCPHTKFLLTLPKRAHI